MALVPIPNQTLADTKVDIIAIPAIGAEPNSTWKTTREGRSHPWLGAELQKEIPSARVLLYDHLNPEERKIQKKPLADADHKPSAERYSAVQSRLSEHDIHAWTDRFLEVVYRWRDGQAPQQQRPLIFLCHSTGGIVVKEALSRKVAAGIPNLAAACIGITFFATPHHGSNVLSRPAFALAVKDRLKLKWEMSEVLMADFSVQNQDLKLLNHKFASVSLGIKIWNYYESRESDLRVLTAGDIGGENLTTVTMFIVDPSSARMSTSDVFIEGEVHLELNTNHVGTARLADDGDVLYPYIDALGELVAGTSAGQRAAHHALITSIMTDVKVDVHQFYQVEDSPESKSIKIWSEHPSLQDLLEVGPTACLKRRLPPTPHKDSIANGYFKPMITLDHPTEPNTPATPLPMVPKGPSIVIDSPGGTPRGSLERGRSGLGIHTSVPNGSAFRPSSPTRLVSRAESPSRLSPAAENLAPNPSQTLGNTSRPTERTKALRERTYQLPTQSRDKFIWVHVPYTHQGWVPQVLTSISHEKQNPELHKKVLSDQIWRSNHNRSRHASSHARFVRPLCKSLLPKGSSNHYHDEMSTPTSAINQAQFALYLPYIHWDTFQRLQQRALLIRNRSKQDDATPINEDVAKGKSIEHKLIWQYHSSNQPLHCRRTLDQYGYPSLRNTSTRDHDQVLYKQTRTQRAPEEPPVKGTSIQHITAILRAARDPGNHPSKVKTMKDNHAKVLMVDQLWLWILDDETIVSFAPPKERDESDGGLHHQGDLRRAIYKDINGDFSRPCDDCFDFAALVVYHAVTALLDQTEDKDLQVFRIFEEYISELTEQQTKSFKEFRDHHRFRDLADLDKQRFPDYVDNRDDLDAVLELRDIDDELGTVEKLLGEQHRCVKEMLTQFDELKTSHNRGHKGYYLLKEVDQIISGYQSHVASMKKSAEAAQQAFEKLLDMKQKQANIFEAHLAREQTEVATEQSRSVMIFTIFTIIFLPLSFFASVFGINAREWSGTATNPSLHKILVYMGTISLAVIIIALLVAFNRATRKVVQRAWKWIGAPVTHLLDRLPGRRIYGHRRLTDVEMAELMEIDRESQRRRSESRPTRETPTWREDIFKKVEKPKRRSESRPRRASHVMWQEEVFTKGE